MSARARPGLLLPLGVGQTCDLPSREGGVSDQSLMALRDWNVPPSLRGTRVSQLPGPPFSLWATQTWRSN